MARYREDDRDSGRGSERGTRGGQRRNDDEIGALWERERGEGRDKSVYFSGVIEVEKILKAIDDQRLRNDDKLQIVVFNNDYKERDNQPDKRILLSKPQEQGRSNRDDRDGRRTDRRDDR